LKATIEIWFPEMFTAAGQESIRAAEHWPPLRVHSNVTSSRMQFPGSAIGPKTRAPVCSKVAVVGLEQLPPPSISSNVTVTVPAHDPARFTRAPAGGASVGEPDPLPSQPATAKASSTQPANVATGTEVDLDARTGDLPS